MVPVGIAGPEMCALGWVGAGQLGGAFERLRHKTGPLGVSFLEHSPSSVNSFPA